MMICTRFPDGSDVGVRTSPKLNIILRFWNNCRLTALKHLPTYSFCTSMLLCIAGMKGEEAELMGDRSLPCQKLVLSRKLCQQRRQMPHSSTYSVCRILSAAPSHLFGGIATTAYLPIFSTLLTVTFGSICSMCSCLYWSRPGFCMASKHLLFFGAVYRVNSMTHFTLFFH